MYTLRPYQQAAFDLALAKMAEGLRRFIFCSGTGSGKTVLAAHVIHRTLTKGNPVVFLAHRLELLEQPYQKLLEMGIRESEMGIIRSGERKRFRPTAPVQIASTASLVNREVVPPAAVVIQDECHRSMARSNRRVHGLYPNAVHIGLTATPVRTDGKPLGDAYDEIIQVAYPSELIAGGYIVDPLLFTVRDEDLPDTAGIRLGSDGDFRIDDLAVAVTKVKLVGSIVEHWLMRARGKRTIVFAVNIEHSKLIAEQFVARGVRAVAVDGNTPKEQRAKALNDLKLHTIDVLVSCEIFIEGIDIPEVKCCVMARPTQSLTIWLQSIGRIVRPYNNEEAIVLDHAGNYLRHRHPSQDRDYSLDGAPSLRSGPTALIRTRTCKQCYMVVMSSVSHCPSCGTEFTTREREIEHVDGTLVEVPRMRPEESQTALKRATWDKLWVKSWDLGNKPQWVVHQYRSKFGEDPPNDWGPPARPEKTWSGAEMSRELATLRMIAARQGLPAEWVESKFEIKFGRKVPVDGKFEGVNESDGKAVIRGQL